MFAMTWTVIHEIDEGSPLHGQDEASTRADALRGCGGRYFSASLLRCWP